MGVILKTLARKIISITIEVVVEVVAEVVDGEAEEDEVLEAVKVIEEEEAPTLIIMDKHTTSKVMSTIITNRAKLSLKRNIIRINQIIIRIERNMAILKIRIQSMRVIIIIRKLNILMTLLQTTRNTQIRLNLLRTEQSCIAVSRGGNTKRAR